MKNLIKFDQHQISNLWPICDFNIFNVLSHIFGIMTPIISISPKSLMLYDECVSFFEHLTLSIQYHKMVLPLLSTRKGCLFLASCLNSIQVGHIFPHYCNWSILPTQTCRSSCREMPWSYTAGQWSRWITYMLVGGCISNGRCHWQCCRL